MLGLRQKLTEPLAVLVVRREHAGQSNSVILEFLQERTGEPGAQVEESGRKVAGVEQQSRRARCTR